MATRVQDVLAEISALLELQGESPALSSEAVATVTAEFDATGESTLLDQLRESTPEGLFEMMRVPGLGTARIRRIFEGLHIDTLQELEAAARDGRLVTLPRFGAAAAEQVLRGIATLKESGAQLLLPHGRAEAERLLTMVRAHAGVQRAEIAGSVRRFTEVVGDLDIVAACSGTPETIAAQLARAPGVRDSVGSGTRRVSIRFADGTRLTLTCVPEAEFVVAWWRATGSDAHVRDVVARAAMRRFTLRDSTLTDGAGNTVALADEAALYAALGLPWMPPELREGLGETRAAMSGELPHLVTAHDLRGVLHCHSQYSDGGAAIAELAGAAQARGWSYLGISDHSQSSFYAGGLTTESLAKQHDEIDALNARLTDFRVLKGVEADILPCGRVDYPVDVLDRFDYVIASVHSRFGMDEAQMTHRVLKALDDPHVTILGHPTGRLLLTREPYAIDMNAVLERAARSGVAVELNADPHRLDLDWRLCRTARDHGTLIEIGPDAHSVDGLENIHLGIGMARKGWLSAADVL
ncbi:MAG: DNA polymerase (family 10), partial [Verrucomicrobia bacterium]